MSRRSPACGSPMHSLDDGESGARASDLFRISFIRSEIRTPYSLADLDSSPTLTK